MLIKKIGEEGFKNFNGILPDEEYWTQKKTLHCPDCDGMLLQNEFHKEHKCSKCGKYFLEITKFVKTILK